MKELNIVLKKQACIGRNIFLNVSIAFTFINSIECTVRNALLDKLQYIYSEGSIACSVKNGLGFGTEHFVIDKKYIKLSAA